MIKKELSIYFARAEKIWEIFRDNIPQMVEKLKLLSDEFLSWFRGLNYEDKTEVTNSRTYKKLKRFLDSHLKNYGGAFGSTRG